VEYLAFCAAEVLRRTGLLPHCNAGVLTRDELGVLRGKAPYTRPLYSPT